MYDLMTVEVSQFNGMIFQAKQKQIRNKYIQQMDKLSQISLQNTVTVKIDYILNQQLLVKNFGIIINCLKDLKAQQDKHSSQISNLNELKELVERINEDISKNNEKSSIGQSSQQSLHKEIEQLKGRVTKNESSTHGNTKDINLLLKDMKDAKEDIESLKRQVQGVNSHNDSPSERNLGKNDNLNNEILRELNQQSKQHQQAMNKTAKQIEEMKARIKSLENQLEDMNKIQQQSFSLPTDQYIDKNSLSQILKKLEFLTKKAENMQGQLLGNTRCLHQLNDLVEKSGEVVDGVKENVILVEKELQRIGKLLEGIERQIIKNNSDSNNKDSKNNDSKNNESKNKDSKNKDSADYVLMFSEIEKLKYLYENLLKLVNSMKTSKTLPLQHAQEGTETDRISSNRNTHKFSQEKSFRKRPDSSEVNNKIRQLTQRIKVLQKAAGDDNPQKLPSIGMRKANKTSYNGEKSLKKELAEMRNDLEIWIKSYFESLNKNNGGNLADLEMKVQEMRNILNRKADHQGMKKGLAFLEGKITQLYLYLTEPESEDAMIVKKGFNCLSCSKKVQNLRGKLGPRMNWDNLNTTQQNMHTPPKTGFPKYNETNGRDSL